MNLLFLHEGSDQRVVSLKRQIFSPGALQRKRFGPSDRRFLYTNTIGVSAVVAVGALIMGINQGYGNLGPDASSGMSTGVTVTESIAPTPLPVIRATPGITGPAPL